MPQTSKRSKPYTSLRKQNRHYRQKRSQFVKGLCASAHMNGSEFLIMLASPKGQVETFASEAFRPNVTHWLPENLLREARSIAVTAQEKRINERAGNDLSDRSDGDDDDEEESDKDFSLSGHSCSPAGVHVSISQSRSVSSSSSSSFYPPVPSLPSNHDIPEGNSRPTLQPTSDFSLTPTSATSTLFSPSISSIPTFNGQSIALQNSTIPSHLPSSQSDLPGSDSTCNHELDRTACVPVPDKFYEAKFAALQQKATKRIAKAWIKVIEPKKQTRFPYNKGEASKPSWWPRALRHKEPDHLKSQERTELLIAILRSPLIRIEKLELKTAEEASFLQQDKIPLLKEIYHVARSEERARDAGLVLHDGGLVPFTSNTASLKRHHPQDSDTENCPSRPMIPGGWKRMVSPSVTVDDINHNPDSLNAGGTTGMGRSVCSEKISLNGSAEDNQVTSIPMRTSSRFTFHEVTQGGPFTYQPFPGHGSTHDPARWNAGDLSQMSQVAPRTDSSSTHYAAAPQAYTVCMNNSVSRTGAPTHLVGHGSFSLGHPRSLKNPTIDSEALYDQRAPMSEIVSSATLTSPNFEVALRSSGIPVVSPEIGVTAPLGCPSNPTLSASIDRVSTDTHSAPIHPGSPFDVDTWHGHGEDDQQSINGVTSLLSFSTETGLSFPAHSDGTSMCTPEDL